MRLPYVTQHTYTPDILLDNGIIVELKGKFTAADRSKMLAVRDQNTGLDIRFVFMNPDVRLNRTSKTTYGMWATKKGFKWAKDTIPEAWVKETPSDENKNTDGQRS